MKKVINMMLLFLSIGSLCAMDKAQSVVTTVQKYPREISFGIAGLASIGFVAHTVYERFRKSSMRMRLSVLERDCRRYTAIRDAGKAALQTFKDDLVECENLLTKMAAENDIHKPHQNEAAYGDDVNTAIHHQRYQKALEAYYASLKESPNKQIKEMLGKRESLQRLLFRQSEALCVYEQQESYKFGELTSIKRELGK